MAAISTLTSETLTAPYVEGLLKWYLLNNEYEEQLSNPINRSQTTNNMRAISEHMSDVIKRVGGANNINKIFRIYKEVKNDIKNDTKRLINTKLVILARLQFGVYKLMEDNLDPHSLSDVLVGNSETKGLAEEIIK